jgi:hypothetical protein
MTIIVMIYIIAPLLKSSTNGPRMPWRDSPHAVAGYLMKRNNMPCWTTVQQCCTVQRRIYYEPSQRADPLINLRPCYISGFATSFQGYVFTHRMDNRSSGKVKLVDRYHPPQVPLLPQSVLHLRLHADTTNVIRAGKWS